MNQYVQWVNSVAVELNKLFLFLYKIELKERTANDTNAIREILNWLISYECLILHNYIELTPPMREFKTNLMVKDEITQRLREVKLVTETDHQKLKVFKLTRVQHSTIHFHVISIKLRTEQLVDYAVHNSHTFPSQAHMFYALYQLKNIVTSMCPILHSEFFEPDRKLRLNRLLTFIHYRIVQISNIKYNNILATVQPVFVNYPTNTQNHLPR